MTPRLICVEDDIPWNDVWHDLQEDGWITLRPKGRDLETRWKYVRHPSVLAAYAEDPIGAPEPIENVDFFYGPDAVRSFLRQQRTASAPVESPALIETPVETPDPIETPSSAISTDYSSSWPPDTPAVPAQPTPVPTRHPERTSPSPEEPPDPGPHAARAPSASVPAAKPDRDVAQSKCHHLSQIYDWDSLFTCTQIESKSR